MRSTLTQAIAAVAIPAILAAQAPTQNPEPEIGVRAGWMRLSMEDPSGGPTEKINLLAIPTASLLAAGGVHFTFFMGPQLALEPQFGYLRTSEGGSSFSLMFVALQPEFFITPGAQRSAYFFGQVGFLRESESFSGGSDSESRTVIGGGFGYRRVVRRSLAMRYEARFRRFGESGDFSGAISELGLLIGVGAVIRRPE